jgi:hypothetical protein
MELVEGGTLAGRLKKGKLPIDKTLHYGSQIDGALAKAHAKGIQVGQNLDYRSPADWRGE